MSASCNWLRCLAAAAILFLPSLMFAAEPARITAEGVATIKRPPSLLRMTMILTARGKTVDEAMQALKDRRNAATVSLKKLKATPDSIEFGDAALSGDGNERSEIQRMMRMQSRGGRLPKGLELPKSATVTCTLKAEWPLKYESHDDLLVYMNQLKDQIDAADLAGLKEPKKLTPEEQELEEELANAEQNYSYSSNNEQKPGQPGFLFAAAITPQERQAAQVQAFRQAKEKAVALAAAAELKLADLTELSAHSGAGASDYENYYGRRYYPNAQENENEATSPLAGTLTLQVSVKATFTAHE